MCACMDVCANVCTLDVCAQIFLVRPFANIVSQKRRPFVNVFQNMISILDLVFGMTHVRVIFKKPCVYVQVNACMYIVSVLEMLQRAAIFANLFQAAVRMVIESDTNQHHRHATGIATRCSSVGGNWPFV